MNAPPHQAPPSAVKGLQRTPGPPLLPLRAPHLIIDDFLSEDLAAAMRQDIDAHFARPEAHRPETHQVWNYWFVPDLYTYLRTNPDRVIDRARVEAFLGALNVWSIVTLGMGRPSWPYLSLYVPGCSQGLHNDARNGRFAFVYSLTRDDRRTVGGETLVMHEGDPLRSKVAKASAGQGFYDVIEPKFNRLILFDDRMPHAVTRVEGPMDPVEGRFVMHGHLTDVGTMVEGALAPAVASEPIAALLRAFIAESSAQMALYHGPLMIRLGIRSEGAVEGCVVLVDRVIHPDPGHVDWDPLRDRLVAKLKALRFPAAPGNTVVTQPIMFGAPLK